MLYPLRPEKPHRKIASFLLRPWHTTTKPAKEARRERLRNEPFIDHRNNSADSSDLEETFRALA